MAIADVLKRKSTSTIAGPEPMCVGSDPDDWLVQQCLTGDLSAFDRLVLSYRARVYALARLAVGNEEDAQDITQETFLRAYEALPRYRYQGLFRVWLYTIAANLCKNRLKARRPIVSWEESALGERLMDEAPGPEDQAVARERARAVRQAIEQMSERDRLIVVLYYQDDASMAEIARIVGCRAGAIKVALHRARARLRERLQRSGLL